MASTPAPSSQPSADALLDKLRKRTRRLAVFIVALAVLIVGCGVGVLAILWKLRAIEKEQDVLRFAEAVTVYKSNQDFVKPKLNTIQFLRRGYSITFERVEYTQNGLLLAGTIGNPTQLWITSLALDFKVRHSPFAFRDKIEKDVHFLTNKEMDIGAAQTDVGILNSGSTTAFEVTIPNVKQTQDEVEIAVSFSGERYSYWGK